MYPDVARTKPEPLIVIVPPGVHAVIEDGEIESTAGRGDSMPSAAASRILGLVTVPPLRPSSVGFPVSVREASTASTVASGFAWRRTAHAPATCGVAMAEEPVVLAGDFNVIPSDFDVYNPKSFKNDALLQPATRAAYERLLAQGWTDAIRSLHPEERIYTFWDFFRDHWARDAGLRIDHLLLNARLRPRLREAGVDKWVRGQKGASDHAPAWIVID